MIEARQATRWPDGAVVYKVLVIPPNNRKGLWRFRAATFPDVELRGTYDTYVENLSFWYHNWN